MGGGLMQLVAYGAQDVYLTGNPQITFFKVVYRRHTNFSMECIQQTINGSQTATDNNTGTVTISRNGDLVHKVFVTVPAEKAKNNGSGTVKVVELEIGGQRIDRHTEEYMNVVNELTTPESKAIGLKAMMSDIGVQNQSGVSQLHVPLQFWFCRNPGLALPLIALQYHEVKLKFTWGSGGAQGGTCQVWCDYIYLDTDERRRFAQVSHEYLIEQVQFHNATATTSHKLNFNHPVKELIWVTGAGSNYKHARLTLNGHDRFANQPVEYFQLKQPIDHHTAVPKQNLPAAAQASLLDRQTTTITPNGFANQILTFDTELKNADKMSYKTTNGLFTCAGELNGAQVHDPTIANGLTVGTQILLVVKDNSAAAVTSGLYSAILTSTALVGTNVTQAMLVAAGDGDAGGDGDDASHFGFTATQPVNLKDGVTLLPDAGGGDTLQLFIIKNGNSAQARTSAMTREINCYSFALKPEEHQPSGTCNFSRIDTAKLETGSALTADDVIYAVNYNVLRIMSGMGGLAYSN